eukprot:337486-Chlamydomonas_euryale.AAC.2
MVQRSAAQHGTAWRGVTCVVWRGMAWCEGVWYGVAWWRGVHACFCTTAPHLRHTCAPPAPPYLHGAGEAPRAGARRLEALHPAYVPLRRIPLLRAWPTGTPGRAASCAALGAGAGLLVALLAPLGVGILRLVFSYPCVCPRLRTAVGAQIQRF